MNVTQAIARVRRLLDDRDQNPLVSDADIRDSLVVACEEVWQTVVNSGADIYALSADVVSSSDGVVDLTTQLPLKIQGLSLVSGSMTIPVPAAQPGEGSPITQSYTVRVSYLPRVVFPLVGEEADPIAWATEAIPSNTLDQLLCVTAACDAWIMTGEPLNKALTTRKEELLASVKTIPAVPSHSVLRIGGRGGRAPFAWTRGNAPNTLQLVY